MRQRNSMVFGSVRLPRTASRRLLLLMLSLWAVMACDAQLLVKDVRIDRHHVRLTLFNPGEAPDSLAPGAFTGVLRGRLLLAHFERRGDTLVWDAATLPTLTASDQVTVQIDGRPNYQMVESGWVMQVRSAQRFTENLRRWPPRQLVILLPEGRVLHTSIAGRRPFY